MGLKNDSNKRFVFNFIWKHNKNIIVGFLIAVIVAISYIASGDMPELFVGAEKWFNFIYNISLSIIAAIIFYCFQSIFPNYRKDIIRDNNRYELVKDFSAYMDLIFRDIILKADYFDIEELDSDSFFDECYCGYDEFFSYLCNDYDKKIVSILCEMSVSSIDNMHLKEIVKYIDSILDRYYDLMKSKNIIKYFKLKEAVELLVIIFESPTDNLEVIEAYRTNIITAIKRVYLITREIQKMEDVKPQSKVPRFTPRKFV